MDKYNIEDVSKFSAFPNGKVMIETRSGKRRTYGRPRRNSDGDLVRATFDDLRFVIITNKRD